MACMCGATDCKSCGPAQGYEVVKVWNNRRRCYEWRNPEDLEDYQRDQAERIAAEREELNDEA